MMKAHARPVWISVIALGWLLDFLFWKQAPGVNFALYAALCLIAGSFLLRLDGVRISSRSAWLLPFIAFFAIITFVRAEPLTMSLAVVIALFLMAVLAITFAGGRWLEYNLTDYALGLLRLAWSVMSRPFAFRGHAGQTSGRTGAQTPWPIIRGIVLALPILLLFAALLGSADLVFQRQLDDLVKLLSLERLPEYIFRLVYILVAAFALLGVFLHAAADSRDERLLGRQRSTSGRFL